MRRDRKFWEKVVAMVTAGATQAEAAERFGVGRPSVQYWVSKLRREAESNDPELLPVRVVTDAPSFIEVVTGDVTVRVSAESGPEYVARLVRALRAC